MLSGWGKHKGIRQSDFIPYGVFFCLARPQWCCDGKGCKYPRRK